VHLFELGENLAGMAEQGFAGWRRLEAARMALEKIHAEHRFKLGQALTG